MNDEATDDLIDHLKNHINYRSQRAETCHTCHHGWPVRQDEGSTEVTKYWCNLLKPTLGLTFQVNPTDVCDKHRGTKA